MVAPIAKAPEPPKLPDAAAPVTAPAALAADAKVGATQPGAVQPDAMAPTKAKKQAKVIQKTKPTRRLKPGDLVCGECGEGNPPARKFCSRCGSSLDTAAPVKIKWWRKLIPKRKVKTLEVGERPGQGGVKGKKARKPMGAKIRKFIGFAGIALTLLFTFVAPARTWAQENLWQPVKDKWDDLTTQDFETVTVVSSTASSEFPEFPVGNAFDLVSNSMWQAPFTESQIVITANFQEPIDIDKVLIQNGNFDNYTGFSRPRHVHLIFSTGETYDFELKDSPEPETYEIDNGAGALSVQIFIVDLYQSPQSPDVAITEWEWKTET